jgi:tripartite-type tricarboxylate transporter receptor subunit TctC
MYVGSTAGGGYDQIARLVARNLSAFLPGQPKIVIENMPTAGGIVAMNFLYNSAPRDGSVILAATNTATSLPFFHSPVARYDPRKFSWIGSTGKDQALCVAWKSTGIQTLEDATKRVVMVSATAMNEGPTIYPSVSNALFGTQFKIISGYTGGNMQLAVERGEVDGLCGYTWQSYQAIGSKWFVDGKVNILAQFGLEKSPDLPDVPLANDMVHNADDKQVLDLITLPHEFARPYVAPPGVPDDRMAIYRKAFKEMLQAPSFLDDAKRQRILIDALDDHQIRPLLDRAYAEPEEVIQRAASFASQMN